MLRNSGTACQKPVIAKLGLWALLLNYVTNMSGIKALILDLITLLRAGVLSG